MFMVGNDSAETPADCCLAAGLADVVVGETGSGYRVYDEVYLTVRCRPPIGSPLCVRRYELVFNGRTALLRRDGYVSLEPQLVV